MPNITIRTVNSVSPKSKAYFVRDSNLKGFALRVFPSGTIKYVAEVWHGGRSHRKTLGAHPMLKLSDARKDALAFMQRIHSGKENKSLACTVSLEELFNSYMSRDGLKSTTKVNHRQVLDYHRPTLSG